MVLITLNGCINRKDKSGHIEWKSIVTQYNRIKFIVRGLSVVAQLLSWLALIVEICSINANCKSLHSNDDRNACLH